MEHATARGVAPFDAERSWMGRKARPSDDLEGGLEHRLSILDPAPNEEARLRGLREVGGNVGRRLTVGQHALVGVVADPLVVAVAHDIGVGRRLERERRDIEPIHTDGSAGIGIVRVRAADPAATG